MNPVSSCLSFFILLHIHIFICFIYKVITYKILYVNNFLFVFSKNYDNILI
nr:MAG TPA: hypothetical protein [Caudoviricetes sp.]